MCSLISITRYYMCMEEQGRFIVLCGKKNNIKRLKYYHGLIKHFVLYLSRDLTKLLATPVLTFLFPTIHQHLRDPKRFLFSFPRITECSPHLSPIYFSCALGWEREEKKKKKASYCAAQLSTIFQHPSPPLTCAGRQESWRDPTDGFPQA